MTTTSVSALATSPTTPIKTATSISSTHLIILVHGWQGNDKELGYLQETMERQEAVAAEATMNTGSNEQQQQPQGEHEEETLHLPPRRDHYPSSRIVFHSAKCNLHNTSDGIAPGGSRLVQEIEDQIQTLLLITKRQNTNQQEHIIWLSFIGNSLGGLYSRYAIAHFDWTKTRSLSLNDNNNKNDNVVLCSNVPAVVKPMLFVTIATPHLGVGNQNTYIPLPRRMERMVGNVLGATGQDLFGITNIVHDLGTQDYYLQPLQRFQKRIAVANAFGTDFQVPTTTGAFLSSTSSYPHKTMRLQPSQKKEYYLALETEPNDDIYTHHDHCNGISQCLDRLGWTKIFLDVRKDIPLPAIPLSWSFFTKNKPAAAKDDHDNTYNDIMSIPPTKVMWKSYELIPFLSQYGNQWTLPLGHMVSCANSRDGFNRWFNANGQSKMDQLGHDILEYSKMYITKMTDIETTATMADQSNGECATNVETQ